MEARVIILGLEHARNMALGNTLELDNCFIISKFAHHTLDFNIIGPFNFGGLFFVSVFFFFSFSLDIVYFSKERWSVTEI